MKSPKDLEFITRGYSNHYRIRIIILLLKQPGLHLEAIADALEANYITVGAHTKRLTTSGLVSTKIVGVMVQHELTERGEQVARFLKKLK